MNRDYLHYLEVLGFDQAPFVFAETLLSNETSGDSDMAKSAKTKAPKHTEALASKAFQLDWKSLEEKAHNCQSCKLAGTRNSVVFGIGNKKAELMFVGEGPGADEDEQGVPFVGRAGQLLTKMIEAMGISRDQVFIANVVKCRPPNNRNPEPDEIAECSPYLLRQVQLVSPKIIVALGTFASQTLLETDTPIGQLRGQYHNSPKLIQKNGDPIKVMPTFHPAFCLRNPNMKKPVWEDLQKVMTDLGLNPKPASPQI